MTMENDGFDGDCHHLLPNGFFSIQEAGIFSSRVGKGEIKNRSFTKFRLYPDTPPMPLDYLFAKCESKPRSRIHVSAVKTFKKNKDFVVVFFLDSNSIIPYGKLPIPIPLNS